MGIVTKIGAICRSDSSGLGVQTLRLARLLNPDKIMLIDSTSFNGNKQHYEWYEDYKPTVIQGFPTDYDVREFIKDLDVVISCGTFYNNSFTELLARDYGVRCILICNPEFMDWFNPQWAFKPLPEVIVPSRWMMEEMEQRFQATYLPTPIFDDEFKQARETNLNRSYHGLRFCHS